MSHSLTAAVALFAPLARLMGRRFRPHSTTTGVPPRMVAPRMVARQDASLRPTETSRDKPIALAANIRRQRLPLRVVRVIEAGQASALAGRILMSGRMADVCAELDRMVEREAAMRSAA